MTRLLLTAILWSFKNRTLARIRRLRQARYLVSLLAAIAYFTFVFRPWRSGPRLSLLAAWAVPGEGVLDALEIGAAFLLTILVTLPWILPGRRGALVFTQAEIDFLFPAPLTRKQVIDYSLMKSQVGVALSSLILGFVIARAIGGRFLGVFIVVWAIFTAMNLYSLAAGIVVSNISLHGSSGFRRAWAPLAPILAAGGMASWGILTGSIHLPGPEEIKEPVAYVLQVGTAPPLGWLLWPCRKLVHPLFETGLVRTAIALIPAALVILASYAWVIRSDHRYEEASAERAARRAARREARLRTGKIGRLSGTRAGRPPFPLPGRASPAVALFWRSVTAAWRLSGWRPISGIVAAAMGASWIYAALFYAPEHSSGVVVATVLSLTLAAGMILMGPDMVRTDLRSDLLQIDVLKVFPVNGSLLIATVVLAPAALITGTQILLLLTALPLVLVNIDAWTGGEMIAAGAGALLLAVPLNLVMSLLHNAALLLFPGWHQLGPSAHAHGVEVFGQNIVSMLLRLLSFAVVLLPAAAIAALTLFFAWPALGPASIPLAALLAGVPALLMAWLGFVIVGLLFERFDPSRELDGLI